MKKWLYATGLSLALTTSAVAQAADKIAVVNISSIFEQSPQRTVVSRQLENEFKDRAKELQSIERDIQTKMQRLQRDNSTMKANERNLLEKSVIAQRQTLSTKVRAFEQDNHRRQTEERNKILSCIQKAVKDVATKKGYDVVIDTNAIAYATNIKDITDDVLRQVK